MYKVIHEFLDLQDNNHYYKVGDKFPHKEMEIGDDRIAELSTNANKIGVPLIEKVKTRKKTKKKE